MQNLFNKVVLQDMIQGTYGIAILHHLFLSPVRSYNGGSLVN